MARRAILKVGNYFTPSQGLRWPRTSNEMETATEVASAREDRRGSPRREIRARPVLGPADKSRSRLAEWCPAPMRSNGVRRVAAAKRGLDPIYYAE